MKLNSKVNKILESEEFLTMLKGIDEKEREAIEISAKEMLNEFFNTLDGITISAQKIKKEESSIDSPAVVVKEKE